ncbi:MAG: hypothetical protein LAO77_01735 [Acidobacteriia bacterium]|nr:hypothetical protein [Terriglobia bacterium]
MISQDLTLVTVTNDVIASRAAGNTVAFQITNKARSAWAGLLVRVSIPCGSPGRRGPFLMASDGEPVTVRCQMSSGGAAVDLKPVSSKDRDQCAWAIGNPVKLDPGAGFTLTIADFSASTCDETGASIRLVISVKGQADVYDVLIGVRPGKGGTPMIQDFGASPDYVLHAGGETVTLSCFVTGATKAILYKNNVRLDEQTPNGTDPIAFEDRPSITSVYKLEARANDVSAWAQQTVHVAQPGWNRQALEQGYPTLLASAGGDRLFGIFVDAATQSAGLWSSPTGFSDWQPEGPGDPAGGDGAFPQEMSHSPGVFFDNRLWLIGGSSVDPAMPSNKVSCWESTDGRSGRAWVEYPEPPQDFTARMGHACVVFRGEIWVLGGYTGTDGGAVALNDAWSYQPSKGWTKRGKAAWSARCLFAAAVTAAGAIPGRGETLWIYGGFESPGILTPKEGLWSTQDGVTWKEETNFELRPDPGVPRGATLLFNTLDDHLLLAGSFLVSETKPGSAGTQVGAGRLSSHVFTLHPDRFVWEDSPVSWGWELFGGNPFLMRSLVFNGFLFFWSIYRDIDDPPKLNIFIPS